MQTNATPDQVSTILTTMVNALHAQPVDAGLIPPLMIWGPPGIGKSAIVQSLARQQGIGLVDVRLAQREPVDMRGLPVPDGDSVRWLVASEWPRDPDSKGIIFFDELTAADSTLQAAAYELILDRRLGDLYRVPDGWYIVAAGNRLEDHAVASTMSSALANRFCHLEMTSDTSTWLSWARKTGIHPTILGFLAWRPDMLFKLDRDSQRGWASPRSWERASYLLKLFDARPDLPHEDLLALQISGLVGEAIATEFLAFRHLALEGPSAECILLEEHAPIVPQQGDRRFALASALIHVALTHRRRHKDVLLRLLKVTEAFGADFATMIVNAVTDALSLKELESLMATPEMTSWRKRHGITVSGAVNQAGLASAGKGVETQLFDVDTLMRAAQ